MPVCGWGLAGWVCAGRSRAGPRPLSLTRAVRPMLRARPPAASGPRFRSKQIEGRTYERRAAQCREKALAVVELTGRAWKEAGARKALAWSPSDAGAQNATRGAGNDGHKARSGCTVEEQGTCAAPRLRVSAAVIVWRGGTVVDAAGQLPTTLGHFEPRRRQRLANAAAVRHRKNCCRQFATRKDMEAIKDPPGGVQARPSFWFFGEAVRRREKSQQDLAATALRGHCCGDSALNYSVTVLDDPTTCSGVCRQRW